MGCTTYTTGSPVVRMYFSIRKRRWSFDYCEQVILYIHLNPVRAGLVDDPAAYEFCGHRELVKRIHDPLVDVDHALIGFGSTLKEAKSRYKGRIRAGMDESPSEDWAGIFGLSGPRDAGSPRISEDPGGISAGVTHPNADGHPPQNHP